MVQQKSENLLFSSPLLPKRKSSTSVLSRGCRIFFPSAPTCTKEPQPQVTLFISATPNIGSYLGSCSNFYFLGIDFPCTQAENKPAEKLVSGLKPSDPPVLGRVAVYILRQPDPKIVALVSLTHISFSTSMFQGKKQTDWTKDKKKLHTKQTRTLPVKPPQ